MEGDSMRSTGMKSTGRAGRPAVYSEFEGQTAVITGAASGIGQSLAELLAEQGANIVIPWFRGDPHDPQETVSLVEDAGGEALVVPTDVSRTSEVVALFDAAEKRFGTVRSVVAAAGILRNRPLTEMTDDDWDDMLQVDLHGVMRTLREGIRRMDDGGSLVAISSIAGGVYGWADHAHYATSKAGVLGLVRSAAVEQARRGIRVNAVIPGLIESPQSSDPVNSLGPDGLRAAGEFIPWGRVGTTGETARVIRFLLSDEARYVTGQQFIVDGGLTVAMRE
jgi:3-oxoacyl-[acyl-carrier protein] reductase